MSSQQSPESSYHEDYNKSLKSNGSRKYHSLDCHNRPRKGSIGSSGPSSLPGRRSTPTSRCGTPTASRRRFLDVPTWKQSCDSLASSQSSSRCSTPFRSSKLAVSRNTRSRSRSPRPMTESEAINTPGIQQEAFTNALLYPSSLHRNLRLVAMFLVMAHVSYKTLGPSLFTPIYNKLSCDYTTRSVTISIPWYPFNSKT